MAKFKYTGDAGRYYPDIGLEPTPGESYELDAAPDVRWTSEFVEAIAAKTLTVSELRPPSDPPAPDPAPPIEGA